MNAITLNGLISFFLSEGATALLALARCGSNTANQQSTRPRLPKAKLVFQNMVTVYEAAALGGELSVTARIVAWNRKDGWVPQPSIPVTCALNCPPSKPGVSRTQLTGADGAICFRFQIPEAVSKVENCAWAMLRTYSDRMHYGSGATVVVPLSRTQSR